MYSVSETFKDYIKRNTVSFLWHGNVVDKDENSYELIPRNIVQNSGKITRRCSTDELSIGTTCASELQLNLYLDIDRYLLYGGVITLDFTLAEGDDTEDIPMGEFTIAECTQSNGQLHIIAYDAMTKFDDVPFSATLHNVIQTPYAWLLQACTACGVTLGMTSAQVIGLPNGNRETGFADVISDAKSWRDVLGYLATYLGSFAYIGRDGKLYLNRYTALSIDTIPASFRYSSNFSDYRTTYDGIYCINKDSGVQEYVSNNNTGGLILDIGTNPFLQFSEQANRLSALSEIINSWNGVYYVPYEVDMPIVPYYDPGDVLTFTGNQADQYDYGAITEIVFSMSGRMSVKCAGDNPRLALAQDRFTKTVAGLSSDYNNGQEVGTKNFWLLHTENTAQLTVDSTWTQVAEIEFKQTTDVQKLGTVFSCEAILSKTSTVEVRITIDDEEAYRFDIKEEKSMKGTRPFHSSKGFRVTDKGTHVAKVYMKVTDNPTRWGDLV